MTCSIRQNDVFNQALDIDKNEGGAKFMRMEISAGNLGGGGKIVLAFNGSGAIFCLISVPVLQSTFDLVKCKHVKS